MKYMAILGHLNGPWDYNKNIINNYNIIKIYTNLIMDNPMERLHDNWNDLGWGRAYHTLKRERGYHLGERRFKVNEEIEEPIFGPEGGRSKHHLGGGQNMGKL